MKENRYKRYYLRISRLIHFYYVIQNDTNEWMTKKKLEWMFENWSSEISQLNIANMLMLNNGRKVTKEEEEENKNRESCIEICVLSTSQCNRDIEKLLSFLHSLLLEHMKIFSLILVEHVFPFSVFFPIKACHWKMRTIGWQKVCECMCVCVIILNRCCCWIFLFFFV